MITDHYATLGLAPYAEQSAIRAAYLALMRRYHPDRNQSDAAASHVREVTAAYEVLGNRDRRTDYDLARAYALAALATEKSGRPAFMGVAAALFASAVLAWLMLIYLAPFTPEVEERMERKAAVRSPQPAAEKPVDPATRCSSASNAEFIKRALFARAAQLRGSDGAVYRKIASYSLVRLQEAKVKTDRDTRTLYCNAVLGLDLPPGVSLPGGRRSVSSEIGYSLQSAEGRRDALELFHGGTIAKQLATLVSVRAAVDPDSQTDIDAPTPSQMAQPAAPIIPVPLPAPRIDAPRAVLPPRSVPVPRAVAPIRPMSPPRATGQQPAKCGPACTRPAVAGLDRTLGALFRQSVNRADAAKKRTLYRDHYSFVARLGRCTSDACAREEYLGRMREISRTMAEKPR